MNYIAEEINNFLMHVGMPRRSGRYPWGSGDDPYQHSGDFYARVKELKDKKMSETEIAKALNLSTTQLRAYYSIAKDERKALFVDTVKGLQNKGYNVSEIARELGKNESSIRSILKKETQDNINKARVTADFLKDVVDKKGMVDVGEGVEFELGNISKTKLNDALTILDAEGYPTYVGSVPQATNPGQKTNIRILCPPGTEYKDIYSYQDGVLNIYSVKDYEKMLTKDGTVEPAFAYPESLSSKRIKIRYAEEGGIDKDGVVELRRGVEDISLGDSHYAQVRIMVDGTHYIKGMAVYSDDMPDGIDVVFNTNKKSGTPMCGDKNNTVLKNIKTEDPDNPFGSLIKERGGQRYYFDENGEKKLSVINKTREEGEWGEWSKELPSQFLSKQKLDLINKQLNLAIADKEAEYNEIMSHTNPNVKRKLLNDFADECDTAAVHLKAASLPRQRYQVILPLDIPDDEVYAPNYRPGETVALVRYPHGGTFEIPIVKVNNNHQEGKDVIGTSGKVDAIGISKKVADRLSGADFDGDTVMVIPTGRNGIKISSRPQLEGLKDFDPKDKYGPTGDYSISENKKFVTVKDSEGGTRTYRRMTNTQNEMGRISNLINDMTLKGADDNEVTRAVKHSMVVIDAEKHNLDYKRSEQENGIASLKKKYQGHINEEGKYSEGAATLISRAKSQKSVVKRQGSPQIAEDGSLVYKTAKDATYVDKKTGKTITRMQKSTQMAETKDAHTLSTGTPKEEAYAKYANKCKALANNARKEANSTKTIQYNASAKKMYEEEVASLNADLNLAKRNAPRERMAQLTAAAKVSAIKKDNPSMTKEETGKVAQRALIDARNKVGASRHTVSLTPKKWEAITSGAVSSTKLDEILRFANPDEVKQYSMPRKSKTLSPAQQSKAKAMKNSGYTNQDIADSLGVSTSTVSKVLTNN